MTIKTLTIRMMAMLAFTLTLGACSENENDIPNTTKPDGEKITFTVSLPGTETRLSHSDPSESGVKVKWTYNDVLKLFLYDYTNALGTYTVVENSISADGKTATFTGNPIDEGDYVLFGPGDKIPDNDSGFGFKFSWLGQKQATNNNLAHLKDYDLIEASFYGSNITNLRFTHRTALFQFNLTGLPAGTYTNFAIQSSETEGILVAFRDFGDFEYTQNFPLELDNIVLNGNENLTLWLMMPVRMDSDPMFKAGTLTLAVTDNSGNTYTNTTAIVLSSDQTYEQGERYSMTAAMQLQ